MSAFDLLADWPAEKISAGWINRKGTSKFSGDPNQIYELASVTKAIFSMAVLVAAEEGTLELNEPAGPEGSTISNLLSHSSGLAAERRDNEQITTLALPGQKRIYSNQGFDILGDKLSKAASMTADSYFQEAIANQLGLSDTKLYGSPAKHATSSVADLLKIGSELLQPQLISTQTLTKATSPHLPALEGVLPGYGKQTPNPWGLGLEIKGMKSPHWTAVDNSPATFGHFGQSGTFIWIDPLAEVACVALTDKDFGPWATEVWPAFSQAVLTEAVS